MREIVLPEAKPALEWVNGRVLQKVSPKRRHSLAQAHFAAALVDWALKSGAGMVGTEWRFRLKPPRERRRPLVPDVAFLSYQRMSYDRQQVTEEPGVAPDAVVEVLSPRDRSADVAEKIRVYLEAGSQVVFLVDPKRRVVTTCTAEGRQTCDEDDVLKHQSLPGFEVAVRRLFTPPRPK